MPAARKFQDIYAGIIENEARMKQIIADVVRSIEEGRTSLLLTEGKDHAARLAEELRGKAGLLTRGN